MPTLTLLIGPSDVSIRCWRDWAEHVGRNVIVSSEAEEGAFAAAWMNGLTIASDLVERVLTWLAMIPVEPALLSRNRLERMSPHDFNNLWHELFSDLSQNPTAFVAYKILTATILGTDLSQDFRDYFAGVAENDLRPSLHALLAGFAGLLPASDLPAILLTAPARNASAWFRSAANLLGGIATAVPAIPLAIAATADEVESFLRAAPDSRLTALLREGRIELEALSAVQIQRQLAISGITVLPDTAALLAKSEGTTDRTTVLIEAADNLTKARDAGQEELARSAAERFLFEVLESWPATAGQFRLNERFEFLHGTAPAEGDLVAPASRLVIELDGSYHHLADAEAYRRDRKKDYSYQRHGYLVLRFLSEDVVTRLHEILRTIEEALAHQSHSQPKQRLEP